VAKPISLQLYTLREAAKDDFPGVLKAVADIGYVGVEFAGLQGHDPKEIRKLVDDLGLKVSSSHTGLPTAENIGQLADTELILGNKKVISGFGPDQFKCVNCVKDAAAKFRTAAQLVKPFGMTYGFHNHWWEFHTVDGKLVYDVLMAEAPDVFSELDVYWCAYGKGDPVKVVSQYKSRLPVLHIKDGSLGEDKVHLAVGSGVLDVPAIIGAADPNVLEWVIVELDNYDGDMFEAVQSSYDYLVGFGLALGNK